MRLGIANITNQSNPIADRPIIYGLIDIGNVSTNKVDFDFRAFRPCFKVKEMLEKIRIQSGYTWDFPYLGSSLFDRLVIPTNKKQVSNSTTQSFNADAVVQSYNTTNIPAFTVITAGSFVQFGSSYKYTGATSLSCTIDAELIGQFTSVQQDGFGNYYDVIISLRINGSPVVTDTFPISYLPSYFSFRNQYQVTLNTNDYIDIYVSSAATQYDVFSGMLKVSTATVTDVAVNYNETIQFDKQLPQGIFQKDFFLSICKMLNLYVYDDPIDEKKIIIKPYIDFYSGATVDWTNKIDRAKPMRIKPMSEINARYYQFKFKQDNDVYNENYRKKYNEGYGDRIYDTEFDFVKDTDTTEVIFSATPLYQKTGTDKIYPAIYKIGSSNIEESIDFNLRIFQAKYITDRSAYKITDNGVNKQTNVTTYTYVGHLDDPFSPTNDINFGAPKEVFFSATTYPTTNLFNAYYSDYMAEITDKDSKLLTCNALLNTIDIYNLDFGKLIWIDGVLFRLNTIEEYNPMDYTTTKVSLLKAIEKTF